MQSEKNKPSSENKKTKKNTPSASKTNRNPKPVSADTGLAADEQTTLNRSGVQEGGKGAIPAQP